MSVVSVPLPAVLRSSIQLEHRTPLIEQVRCSDAYVRSIVPVGQVLLMVCGGCDRNRSQFIPDNLVGVWVTDNPRYRGRSLELSKDSAVIGTGDDKATVESVESVKIQPAGEETNYSIHCRTLEGTEHLLTLHFTPKGDGEIRLSHPQSIVWKRRPNADGSPHERHIILVPRPLYEIDCIRRNCSRDW